MHLSSAGVTLYTAFPDEARKLRDKRVKVNRHSTRASILGFPVTLTVLSDYSIMCTVLYCMYFTVTHSLLLPFVHRAALKDTWL